MLNVLHTEQISPVEIRSHLEHFLVSGGDMLLRRTFEIFVIDLYALYLMPG